MNERTLLRAGGASLLAAIGGAVTAAVYPDNRFVIVVTACLGSAGIVLLFVGWAHMRSAADPLRTYDTEASAAGECLRIAKHREIATVAFISAGVVSRRDLIREIAGRVGKRVRVLSQHPDSSVDSNQRASTIKSVRDTLVDLHSSKGEHDVQVRFYREHASVRGALFRDANGASTAALLGWYTYRDDNALLFGSQNPSFRVGKRSSTLLKFADDEFDRLWVSAEPIDVDAAKQLYKETFPQGSDPKP